MEKIAKDFQLTVLIDGTPTKLTNLGINANSVVLALASDNIAPNSQWKILYQCGHSAHKPILCKI